VPAEAREALRKQALPRELDKLADQARELRECFRGVVKQHKGRPLGLEDFAELAPLNRLLERDESYVQIAPHDQEGHRHFGVQRTRRWRSPESLLLPVGEALANFVCVEDFTDIKSCEGPSCTLMFVDRTRGRRRWFSMAICGNGLSRLLTEAESKVSTGAGDNLVGESTPEGRRMANAGGACRQGRCSRRPEADRAYATVPFEITVGKQVRSACCASQSEESEE
jgi:predicted RNA-binding Zn ribbon-like protein